MRRPGAEKKGAPFGPDSFRDVDAAAPATDTPPVWILLQAAQGQAELPGGYGAALLQGIISLGAVCLIAWVVLRFGARRGLGMGRGQRVRILERTPLDARRSLYLVEVGGKVLLIGTGDGAGPQLVTEIDPESLPELPDEPAPSFRQVLDRMRGKEPAVAESSDD